MMWEVVFHGYRSAWVVKRFRFKLTALVYKAFCTDRFEVRRAK